MNTTLLLWRWGRSVKTFCNFCSIYEKWIYLSLTFPANKLMSILIYLYFSLAYLKSLALFYKACIILIVIYYFKKVTTFVPKQYLPNSNKYNWNEERKKDGKFLCNFHEDNCEYQSMYWRDTQVSEALYICTSTSVVLWSNPSKCSNNICASCVATLQYFLMYYICQGWEGDYSYIKVESKEQRISFDCHTYRLRNTMVWP